jgi:APA family basic amino acid/polyamine antiporter
MIGWDLMLEYGLVTSAVSVGWSGYFQSLLGGFGLQIPVALSAAPGAIPGVTTFFNLPAFLIMMALTVMLSLGVRESARINNIMVVVKIGVVLLFILVGARHVAPANWQPFMPFGVNGVMSAAALVFFAFIGFDAVTTAAEEVKNPKRDLPIGIIGSLAVCTVLYVIVSAIMTGIVPFTQFKGIDHPVSLALQFAGENWFAGFRRPGRHPRHEHRDPGDGLRPEPRALRHVARRPAAEKLSALNGAGTPIVATWLVGIVFGLLGALVPLQVLGELANIGTLAAFCLVSLAVIVLRKQRPDLPRAFRCPGVPVIPVLAILFCGALMIFLSA